MVDEIMETKNVIAATIILFKIPSTRKIDAIMTKIVLMNAILKATFLKIPKDKAKLIHERIEVFINMYLDEQRFQSKFKDFKPEMPEFDLKTLCYSCYSQGLTDAVEACKINTKKL